MSKFERGDLIKCTYQFSRSACLVLSDSTEVEHSFKIAHKLEAYSFTTGKVIKNFMIFQESSWIKVPILELWKD